MKKDGPGKAIIMALAVILGGIISSGIVLLRHGMHQRKLL
jgi:LPS O-antigen subunit length determinant protein (WzzB/FepE family)